MNLIELNKKSILNYCILFHIKDLFVFGSILKDTFNENSDIDLLVSFEKNVEYDYFLNYMDFKDKMEELLNRKVDLVESQTLKNPILINSINKSKQLVYERKIA